MIHLDSGIASSPDITLAPSLLLRRVYMIHHQPKNDKDKVDSPLPYHHCMCWSPLTTPGLTLPYRTTVSAALTLLSHPMQPGFTQILKCLSISSAGFTQSLLCFMLPIQITISYPLFWLQTQNRLKGEGRFSCVPQCFALLHPLYEMGGSPAILNRRPRGHNVLPALVYATLQDQL